MKPKEAALLYAAAGYRIFPLHAPVAEGKCSCGKSPCKIGKHPVFSSWEIKASSDEHQVREWWNRWPQANIALLLEDLIVLDIDVKSGGFESFGALEKQHGKLDAWTRQYTGSGGLHILFSGAAGVTAKPGFMRGLDLLTGNGYIVLAPSLHACGQHYVWANVVNPMTTRLEELPLSAPPSWLLEAASKAGSGSGSGSGKSKTGTADRAARPSASRLVGDALNRVAEGVGRNDTGLWLFCQCRDNGFTKDEASELLPDWVAAVNEATEGQDSYAEDEAKASLEQAYRRASRDPWKEPKAKKENQADELLKLCHDFEYFRSGPAGDAYVRVQIGEHKEVWPVDSTGRKVREILTQRYLADKGRAPSREALGAVADTVLAKCGAGPKMPVYVRFARTPELVHVDLCDDEWRVIEITSRGWKVLDESPVLFRRPSGALPLPLPVRGGSLDTLRPLLNAGTDEQWILMLAWLVGAFQPVGAFSHLLLEGEQGSGKSSTARLLLHCIDPNECGLSGPPKDEADATIAALNSGILAFDNLSGCRAEISDIFCRFSTGQGFKTRTLYTNSDLSAVTVKIPLLMNGTSALTKT